MGYVTPQAMVGLGLYRTGHSAGLGAKMQGRRDRNTCRGSKMLKQRWRWTEAGRSPEGQQGMDPKAQGCPEGTTVREASRKNSGHRWASGGAGPWGGRVTSFGGTWVGLEALYKQGLGKRGVNGGSSGCESVRGCRRWWGGAWGPGRRNSPGSKNLEAASNPGRLLAMDGDAVAACLPHLRLL